MPPLHWTSSGCSRAGGGPCDTQQQPLSSRSVDSKQEELASLASRDAFGQMKRTSMASRMYVESIKEEDTGLRGDSRLTHPLDARTYSPALKEVVELITMGKDTPAPVGSYRYLAFKYWGDIDVFEKIYLEKPSDVTARVFTAELQRIILNILNIQAASATYPKEPHRITQKAATAKLVHGVSFLELKCGLHPNTTLSSITGMGKWDYVGRKLVGYDGPHVYRQLSRLLAEGLLSEHVLRKAPCLDSRHSVEAQWSTTYKHWILSMGRAQSPSKLTSRVSSGGAAQRDRAMTEYEFFRQWVSSFPKLRWSPKEIIAGRKVLGNSNGLSMTLEEAVRYSQGEVKLDVAVSLPQGRIIEASVLWQVESEEGLLTKALNPYKESLNSDILKYAGGDKQDFYKTAKRMWSREVYNYYQHIYNDTKRTESLNVLWTLAKLFSSPAAAIARCITDLRTIDHALEARDPIIRGLGYCQKLLLNNVPKMHRSTPQFTSKITSSLKLATAVLRIPATHGVDLVPKTDRRAAAIMESGGVACPWSALDDIIGEVVWEMVQDATVRALACITAVELDQTVVQSEVHHFLRDHRLLPTALRDVESVLDRAIEAFIETGGRDASILLDGYDGGGPGVRGLRIGRVYTILDVLWSGTRSVIFKCRLEDTPDRLSSGGGGGGQQHHQPGRRSSLASSSSTPLIIPSSSARSKANEKQQSMVSSVASLNGPRDGVNEVIPTDAAAASVVVVQLVAVKVFYRPQTDGETSMIMNECKVHKYLSENIVTSSDLSRLEGGGGSNTPEGARDTRSAAAAPPPFPRWIHCGSTDSGLRYSVMDMFEGPTLEQELEDIIEGRRQPYSLGEAQGLMAALLSAVEAAHDVGVIHHNINPRSIVIMKGTNSNTTVDGRSVIFDDDDDDDDAAAPPSQYSRTVALMDWAAATVESMHPATEQENTTTTSPDGNRPSPRPPLEGGPAKDDDHLQQQQQQQSSGVGPVPDWSSLLKIVGWASPEQIQRWAQQSSFGNSVMGIISTAQPAAAASPFPSPPDAVLPSPMDAHQRGAPPMSELAMDLYSCAVVLSQCYSAVRPRSAAAFCGGVPVTTAAAAAQHNPLMLTSSRASHLAHCSTPVTLEDHGLLRVKQLMEAHVQSLDEAQDQLARGVYGLEIVTSPMRAGGDIYRRLVVAIDKYRDTSAAELQSQKRDICPGYPQITSVLRQSLRPRSSDRPTSSCRGLRRLLSIAFDRDILRIIDTSARINRRVLRDSAPTLVLPWSIIADELGVGPLREGHIRRLLRECSPQKKLILFGQAAWAGCTRLCRVFMEAGVNPFDNPADECTPSDRPTTTDQATEMMGRMVCTGSLAPVQLAIMAGNLSCVELMAHHARRLGRIHVPSHHRRDLIPKSSIPMLSTMPTITTEETNKRVASTPPRRASCGAPERPIGGPSTCKGPSRCIDMVLPHNKGGTALHWATVQCPSHLIRACCTILYKSGHGSPNITNYEGLTPLDTAGCITDKQCREAVWSFFLEIGCRTGHGSGFMWLSLQDRIDMTILSLLLASIVFVITGFITNNSDLPSDSAVKWMFGSALTVLVLVPFMCMVHRLSRAGAVSLWWFRLTHKLRSPNDNCDDNNYDDETYREGNECNGPAKRCAHGLL